MCGIVGVWNYRSGKPVERLQLDAMCDAIAHRGPDGAGVYINSMLGLGHRRLAILDVMGGHQPWHEEKTSTWVVFNGEIYNYKELRDELEKDGYQFRSTCDTEVIPYCYEKYGERFVEHLEGMFAIALWDMTKNQLFLARDRLGKKPLLYSETDHGMVFASEMQSLLCCDLADFNISIPAVDSYLSLGFVPNNLSIFENVHKVLPATIVKIDANGRLSVRRYWSCSEYSLQDKSFSQLIEQFRELLTSAVARRLHSDVPIGAFLSGGIDSSVITALMAGVSGGGIRTFCAGFSENAFDERDAAQLVSTHLGTVHTDFMVDVNAAKILPVLMRHYGEPYADPSAIPTYYLCKMVREHVTVALSGDGGDELLLGYNTYRRIYQRHLLGYLTRRQPVQYFLQGVVSNFHRLHGSRLKRAFNAVAESSLGLSEQLELLRAPFSYLEKQLLYTERVRQQVGGRDYAEERINVLLGRGLAGDVLQRASLVDIELYLPDDILVKVDIASMACGLEVRSPLLDHRVVEFCLNLPVSAKYQDGKGKYLLKALARELLPYKVLDKPKQGFGVPVSKWLREELFKFARVALLDADGPFYEIFNYSDVERLLSEHHRGQADHGSKLWSLMCFSFWLSGLKNRTAIRWQ